jgi:alpha-beta hydrolase superfamily lysophospholipase
VVESIKADYRRDPHQTPIVIIGHSLGGTLAPSLARQLLVAGIPVELMIVVDSRHEITIPGNVRRCVNLYQPAKHGFVRGLPVSAESESTALFNVDVTRYENRAGGEIIDHFNIDESSWMHKVIIREVLRVCPKRAEVAKRK